MIDTITTPRGVRARYAVRGDTNDGALVSGIIGEDEYNLRSLPPLSGWAIDIGAHIGTVAVALALDNPDLRVVAVEALPENVAILRETVALNGLRERVFVEAVAASTEEEWAAASIIPIVYGWSRADNQPDAYMRDNRYIGGMVGANETSTVAHCPALSLGGILAQYEIDDVALLKLDCEGCEWFVLTSPAVAKVALIIGEMHEGRHGDATRLRALLEPTHDVTIGEGNVAHFRAVRR